MSRIEQIEKIKNEKPIFDVAVIGGGATGLGIAVDAASRGFSVILLDKYDLAKGTSSRSTKLVHGGVRYLAQGNIRLVLEALKERGIMRRNAPHLVHDLAFVVPVYRWWMIPFYYTGLKLYDLLSGKWSLGKSVYINRKKVVDFLPTVRQKGLQGGIVYHDGQFDDSRMAVSLAKTAEQHTAIVFNHMEVTQLVTSGPEDLFRLTCRDHFIPQLIDFQARAVFNAAGVFVDDIQKMEHEKSRRLISPSQGTHIVVDRHFMPGNHGLMIPNTPDGRVLFAVPWHDKVLLGTTDTPVSKTDFEPLPTEEEIDFILETAQRYLDKKPVRKDIRSAFAGLRPLAAPEKEGTRTKEISRGHKILVSTNKLITIIGGKWTTYRAMAEDAIGEAIESGLLEDRPCHTEEIQVWKSALEENNVMNSLAEPNSDQAGSHAKDVMITDEDVRYTIREEYALTIEDILSRRLRLLILDAEAALKIAPRIADILASELGAAYNREKDLKDFKSLAENYIVNDSNYSDVNNR